MTLRLRMSLMASVVMLIASAVMVTGVALVVESSREGEFDDELQRQAGRMIATAAFFEGTGFVDNNPFLEDLGPDNPFSHHGDERTGGKGSRFTRGGRGSRGGRPPLPLRVGERGLLAQSVDRDGEVVATSPLLEDFGGLPIPESPDDLSAGQQRLYTASIGADDDAVTVRVLEFGTDDEIVQIAMQRDDLDEYLGQLRFVLMAFALGAATLAGGLGWWLAGRALKPIGEMTDSAEAIDRAHDVTDLVTSPVEDDEVGRLAAALNGLLQRQRDAERAQRDFVADAAHELRSPLTSLSGNVSFLQRDRKARKDDELIDDISRDVGRLVTASADLLMLASIDADRPTHIEEFDLLDSVESSVKAAATAHPDHTYVVDGEAVTLTSDRRLVASIVSNLLDNAGLHTPDGTSVSVLVRPTDAGCRIEVSDDGPGIDPDEREFVFERFHRGRDSSGTPGSGLGLAIVSSVAEHLGGSARLDTEVETGTCVIVEIPDS